MRAARSEDANKDSSNAQNFFLVAKKLTGQSYACLLRSKLTCHCAQWNTGECTSDC